MKLATEGVDGWFTTLGPVHDGILPDPGTVCKVQIICREALGMKERG